VIVLVWIVAALLVIGIAQSGIVGFLAVAAVVVALISRWSAKKEESK
jgi:hypothetical protein